MPDTGAPWNIPYVASTDLVSDWPADSLALANAIDAGLDAAGNAGIGSNVVTGSISSNFTTTSSSNQDTGIAATITLTSATSKVLLISHATFLDTTGGQAGLVLDRGGTLLNARETTRATDDSGSSGMVFVDTPGSVGPHTYKVLAAVSGGATLTLGASATGLATLTAIEVAA